MTTNMCHTPSMTIEASNDDQQGDHSSPTIDSFGTIVM